MDRRGRPILVTGATGNAGREVVAALGSRGAAVRWAVRTPQGGDEVALDLLRPETWDPALDGAGAVFLLRPPPISDMGTTLVPFVARARAMGVERIVFLSVAGAETSRWVPHRKVEAALMAGPTDWTILRPGFFAQNLADAYLQDIREDDRLYVPAGRGRVAFVDLRDVGEVAARALLGETQPGEAYTLTGPRAVDFGTVAQILSQALGRNVRYRPASIPGYAAHLRRRGLPWGAIVVQTLLHVGLRFGQAATVDPTLGNLLGHPPRDIGAFIADHTDLW